MDHYLVLMKDTWNRDLLHFGGNSNASFLEKKLRGKIKTMEKIKTWGGSHVAGRQHVRKEGEGFLPTGFLFPLEKSYVEKYSLSISGKNDWRPATFFGVFESYVH